MGTLSTPSPSFDTGGDVVRASGIDDSDVLLVSSLSETSIGASHDEVYVRARKSVTRRMILVVLMVVGAVSAISPTASAESPTTGCGSDGCVDVIAVEGVIDDIVAAFIVDSVQRADTAGDVVAVVLQMDSPGAAVSHDRLVEIADVIADSSVDRKSVV